MTEFDGLDRSILASLAFGQSLEEGAHGCFYFGLVLSFHRCSQVPD
jgi:hypothetical protein